MELMEWVKIQTLYDSEKLALKTANIVATTEARLANQPQGPQYEVETRIEPVKKNGRFFGAKFLSEIKLAVAEAVNLAVANQRPRKTWLRSYLFCGDLYSFRFCLP